MSNERGLEGKGRRRSSTGSVGWMDEQRKSVIEDTHRANWQGHCAE